MIYVEHITNLLERKVRMTADTKEELEDFALNYLHLHPLDLVCRDRGCWHFLINMGHAMTAWLAGASYVTTARMNELLNRIA